MEKLMQYVWQYRLWPPALMSTTDGRRISIINAGDLNTDAGPDFTNASVKIGDENWYGNIEIHVHASDWFRHGHDKDPAYDSVILHVVEISDADIFRSDGEKIPQLVMTCARDFSDRYNNFVNNTALATPCATEIAALPPIALSDWLTALGMERLQEKADRVAELAAGHDWTEAIYITLARALGFGLNSEPFELLAKTTPLRFLRRHSDDILAIEGILFGQAGLLADDTPSNDYTTLLRREYAFYSAKYGLKPSPNLQWKMARMRPQNSPHRRIATLARFISGGFPFSHEIAEITSHNQARTLFADICYDGFWVNHCNFASTITYSTRALSESSVDVLVINAIIPYLYAYGKFTCNDRLMERAVELLEQFAPERNNLVTPFREAGVRVDDAFTTQALIQLSKKYCHKRLCLFCRLGHRILSAKVKA